MRDILEGLEQGDLKRLVHPELHCDEFQSKLGDDRDVIVLSFKVTGKEPAEDLVSFAEKGYSWVIDAGLSSGEMEDGDYLVFIELERAPESIKDIDDFMHDLMNVTDQKLSDWRVRYYKTHKQAPYSLEALEDLIPATPKDYDRINNKTDLDEMRTAAGIPVTTRAPKNDHTETLRNLAGIRR